MSACDRIRLDLVAYLDEELTGAERAAVEAHLRACPACARELDAQRGADRLLASYAAPAAPADMAARVRARLGAEGAQTQQKIASGAGSTPRGPQTQSPIASGGARIIPLAAAIMPLATARPSWRRWAAGAAIAATLLIGATGLAARFGWFDGAWDPGPGQTGVARRPVPAAPPAPARDPFAPLPPRDPPAPPERRVVEPPSPAMEPPAGAPTDMAPPAAQMPPEPTIARGPEPPPAPAAADAPAELLAQLDLIENLDLLENLDLIEAYDAPEDPTQALYEEERG